MTRDDRVREVVARAKAGEGVVKMHAPFFIQLQPDPSIHLNFWGSPFQPIPGSGRIIAPCHTHNFGFTSHIIYGALINVRYSVAPSKTGKYRKYVIDNRTNSTPGRWLSVETSNPSSSRFSQTIWL